MRTTEASMSFDGVSMSSNDMARPEQCCQPLLCKVRFEICKMPQELLEGLKSSI